MRLGPYQVRGVTAVIAPEGVESGVEDLEILMPVDEQRPAGVIHLVTRAQVDVLQRLGHVEQTSDVHLEAKAPQQAAEDQQVVDEARVRGADLYGPRCHRCSAARSSSRLTPCARSVSMSSFALRTTPSVCSIASASSVSFSSAASAATQSSVSDTPGAL